MLRFIVCLASLILAGAAIAAPPTWSVDHAKSSLAFTVNVNGQQVAGKFKAFGAIIAFDPADLANSRATITLPMDEAKTNEATRDAMLLKPDWFNILDFPKASFQTTSFTHKGGNAYEAQGTLTLKGVTKNVTLPFTLDIKGDSAMMKGEVTLKRLDYGVGSLKEFSTGTPVALEVKVMVNVTARRAK